MTTYQIGFIVEQALGHATHLKNLQAHAPADPQVLATWGPVPWETRGLERHIPLYASNWTVRAGLRARRTVAAMARRYQLDALFFHTQVPAVLTADWVRRIPSVVSLDATPRQYDALGAFYSHGQGPAWLEQAKWRLNRDCFRAARHLVTWSAWAKEGLVAEYDVPADNISVIPPGVDSAAWRRPTPRARHAGPVKILFVGGNLERKGGLLLLAAFRALRPLGVELHLVTRDAVPAEAGLFVYTDMEPNSPRLVQLYHTCDIFCLPTFGDCLPVALAEAGAAGLPAVATRVAGIPEIVHDGVTGWLVPPGDVAALMEALHRLVIAADVRLEQGERAQALVARAFDARHNTLRLLERLKLEADRARGQSGSA